MIKKHFKKEHRQMMGFVTNGLGLIMINFIYPPLDLFIYGSGVIMVGLGFYFWYESKNIRSLESKAVK